MSQKPLVYIILVNWNGYKDTKECLESLKRNTYKNYKIIVIDNGSGKNQSDRIKKKFPKINLIKNSINTGFSYANNQGIKEAIKNKAKYILLLNNDTVVKKDFLDILIDYAEKNNFQGVLTPKILYYGTNKIWAMGGKLSYLTSIPRMIGQGSKSNSFNKIIEPDYASGCAFLVNTDIIKKVGLLDNSYFAYYEDTDLSFRIKKLGYIIKVIPNSIIWHKVSRSTKQKNLKKIGQTQAYLLAKNGLIFGKKNLHGYKKNIYIFAQYFFKLPLYLIFKVENYTAFRSYIKGFFDGLKFKNE